MKKRASARHVKLTDLLNPKGESDPHYESGDWYKLPDGAEWDDLAALLL